MGEEDEQTYGQFREAEGRRKAFREVLQWMKNLEFEMKRSTGVEYHHLWTNLFDNITEAAGEGD
jgi:hypothetical protein